MLTLWQAVWLNQLQQAYHTLSVMEQPHTDTLIEIQTTSTMTNRLPISSSVCREPSTRSKGCSGTPWDPLNHVRWSFNRNADACSFSLPYDVPWEVRTTVFFIKAHRHILFPPPPHPPSMTVPGISHGRLLLSPQQWRSRALDSSRGTLLSCYLCTWKCLWIQVRDRIRSATRAAVYYTTSEGAPTLKCESACYRPFFQRPWNNNGLWLERYPWVTLAAFHKVELFTVRWIKERVAGGASLFHMNGGGKRSPFNIQWQSSILHERLGNIIHRHQVFLLGGGFMKQ